MSTEPNSAHDLAAGEARGIDGRSPEAVVTAFFDAFGRHDVEAIIALLSDDIVEDLPGVGPLEGIESERAFLTGLFAAFPDMVVEVTRVMAASRIVAVEWVRRGSFTGQPFQGLPASGKAFVSRAAGFFEVDDGRISRITVHTDTGQFFRDLGVLPPEGSVGERLALAMFRARVRARRITRSLIPWAKAGGLT
jgi:steroid delta-isomerase-like uncharacterized protein